MRVVEGRRTTHVVDPRSGRPVQQKVARIEVMEAPDAGRSAVRSFVRLMATGHLEDAEELGGQLLDQAALCEVLNTLYDLRLPLLSVECEDWQDEEPG